MKVLDLERRNSAGLASSLFSGLTWGLITVLLRYIMELSPYLLDADLIVGGFFVCCFLNDLFGAVWLSAILGIRGQFSNILVHLKTKEGWIIALGALCGGPLAMTCYIFALSQGGISLTAGVTACYPLIGTIFAVIFLKERMAARRWLGLMVVVVGIYYLTYSQDTLIHRERMSGTLLAFGAAFGWAVEGVLCAYGMRKGSIDHKSATLIREYTSSIAYLIITIVVLKGVHPFGSTVGFIFSHPESWILLVITALIGMYSFYLWYKGIRLIGAARSLCLNVTYPLWALLFKALILGTAVTNSNIFGSVLVVIGVALATLLRPGELNNIPFATMRNGKIVHTGPEWVKDNHYKR